MANYFDNRGYGGSRLNMLPPAILGLLAINVLLFVIGMVPIGRTASGNPILIGNYLEAYGMLFPIGSPYFKVWQFVTYMFLHGGFMHIFLNMLSLWMFGVELAQMWGTKRFLVFYFICGFAAAALHMAVMPFIGTPAPMLGASGAVMGVMAAFAMAYPDRMIILMFIPLRAKYAVLLIAALDLFWGVQNADGIAHFAHLGGLITGFLLVRFAGSLTLGGIFDRPRRRVEPQQQAPRRPTIIDVPYRDVQQPRQQPPSRQAPAVIDFGDDEERINAILDKINRHGYQNLTDEEKAILNDASRRMR